MGYYDEYLSQNLDFDGLTRERKVQLRKISDLRGGRDIMVIAADLNKADSRTMIDYSDILAVEDQLQNLSGTAIDIIIETPGGLAQVVEDLVRRIRGKYDDVAYIIPGWSKSAGTIMAMSGDEILMGPTSALGPIDAQLNWQGKTFSAGAMLDMFEKIKTEADSTGVLNKAYIPILQMMSLGELQHADNAQRFSQALVKQWLAQYKFQKWATHSSNGLPVTDDEKQQRAEEIAAQLCAHDHWLTHGRSIKIDDLERMRLKTTDYTTQPDLMEAILRYYTLLQMSFAGNLYKLFETPVTNLYRFIITSAPPKNQPVPGQIPEMAILDVQCNQCKQHSMLQANLGKPQPLQAGHLPFPTDNKFKCPHCGAETNMTQLRQQIEGQFKKKVV